MWNEVRDYRYAVADGVQMAWWNIPDWAAKSKCPASDRGCAAVDYRLWTDLGLLPMNARRKHVSLRDRIVMWLRRNNPRGRMPWWLINRLLLLAVIVLAFVLATRAWG